PREVELYYCNLVFSPPSRTDIQNSSGSQAQRRYRDWNPPLLGNLPDDFLRILPQQMDTVQVGSPQQSAQGSLDQEKKWKQYLEDERIALFLQNEEFMKELQRNRDFLLALEKDEVTRSLTGVPSGAISDDALFRDKLKHMGKSTRKKLFELARAFSEKTKMRKSKRKQLLKHQVMGTAASTANLLDDVEGHSCGKIRTLICTSGIARNSNST
uniref:CUE domain containing 1 n=1 Tax=Pseudonaja textilis TaxID=8673 RepID=A0A670Z3D6_PSETE